MIIAPLIQRAAELTGYTPAQIKGASRARPLVQARHCVEWAAWRGGASVAQIGRVMGNRDRTSVMYGLVQVEEGVRAGQEWTALAKELEAIAVAQSEGGECNA